MKLIIASLILVVLSGCTLDSLPVGEVVGTAHVCDNNGGIKTYYLSSDPIGRSQVSQIECEDGTNFQIL